MRRLFLASVALVATFAVTSSARAETIRLSVSGGELGVTFGQVPFQVDDALHERAGGFTSLGSFWLAGGSARLESGPLLDLDVDSVEGKTTYTYGAGVLDLSLAISNGAETVTGTFLALTQSFSIVVCEGCDTLFGGGKARDFFIRFESGLFDPALAAFLHIEGEASGFIDFGLEDISGDPLSASRRGFDHRGFAPLEIIVDVPEPAPLIFALTAGAAFLSRRRRSSPGLQITSWRRGISRARTSVRR